MANTTDPLAHSVHGTNPQNLVEKILRTRIYANQYWKEHCFGLNAETLIDKAVKLEYIGGTYSHNTKPTPFICLVLKMLQIQPDKDVVVEFIKQEDYKYLRALGVFYMRLTGRPVDVYQYLEPMLIDYRKLARRSVSGWQLLHMDELVDELLTADSCCDIALPRLPQRSVLEGTGHLPPRVSALEDELEAEAAAEVNCRAGEGRENVDASSVAPPPAASLASVGLASTLLASAVGNGKDSLPRDVSGSISEAAGARSTAAGVGAGVAVADAARGPSHREESSQRGRSRSSSLDPASQQRGQARPHIGRSQRPASSRSPRRDSRREGEGGAGEGRGGHRHSRSRSRSRSGGRHRDGVRGDGERRRDEGGARRDRSADRFPHSRRSRSRSREGRYQREGGSGRSGDAGWHATFGREERRDRGRGSGRSPSPAAGGRDRGRYERYSAERGRGRSASRHRDRSPRMEASSRYGGGRRERSDWPRPSDRGRSPSHSPPPLPAERRAGSVRAGVRDEAPPRGARAPPSHPAAPAAAAHTSAATPAEGSVEYWNDMRAKLGLKPLK